MLPHPCGDMEELVAAPLLYPRAELTHSKQLTPAKLVKAVETCLPLSPKSAASKSVLA